MIFDIPKLTRYLNSGYNVLMSGHAGVGKTAVITEVFSGLKWKYFSAPTMDPWVDLVGVPRAVSDEERGGQVLTLVRPEFVKADDVEAIFIDELNRAPDKVLNALMELIQFGSINGHKLTKLRVVWAAINPHDEDGTYAVNKLDRALTDRFQVQLTIPYKVDEKYFSTKYPEVGAGFCSWWNDLTDAQKAVVSPRRLEYAIEAYMNNDPLNDFLPDGVNIAKLKQGLKALPFVEQLAAITTERQAKDFLKEINKATKLLQLVVNKDPVAIEFYKRWKDVMPQELVDALAPHVEAKETGRPTGTLTEALTGFDKLGNIGEYALTKHINQYAFAYSNGRTLEDDVKGLMATNPKSFHKLVRHLVKVMSEHPKPELKKAMLDAEGKRTNLVTIAMYIAAHDKSFTHIDKKERSKINAHTYISDCAASKWM